MYGATGDNSRSGRRFGGRPPPTAGAYTGRVIDIRPWQPTDDVGALTRLLHRAYAALAAQGLRYVATHQDAATTRGRLESGRSFVALEDGALAGTITYYYPAGDECRWYARRGVARFGQFGVEPRLQGRGIGTRLLQRVEEEARADGARELALDTSEHAGRLIATYLRRGFRIVGEADWPDVNYASVILSKKLQP